MLIRKGVPKYPNQEDEIKRTVKRKKITEQRFLAKEG